jgi:predicted dehydrogenase
MYCDPLVNAQTVKVGVVGLGYWGPNLARNLDALPGCELAWCCDGRPEARESVAPMFPRARFTSEFSDLLADPALDAVVVATPVPSHAELATRALRAGKHCFVEKPLALTAADAERVLAVHRESERTLMVGHLLEYHPGVGQLKQIVDSGELGQVRYIYSNRLNLGKLRADENALWSLGAHDVSVVLHLAGEEPYQLAAHGESCVRPGVEDVVFCFMRFPSGLAAHMHLSWLDPHKERRFTVVGARRMATLDDMDTERKLTVYDKGFDGNGDRWGESVARSWSIYSPPTPSVEPLRLECQHFIECIQSRSIPRSDGESGLRVVRVLEGLQSALKCSRRLESVAGV